MIVMQICLRGKSDSKARNTQKKPTFSRRPVSSGRGEHHPRIGRGRSLAPDAEILVDIDLSILGQDAETFDNYERAIRQEYAHVDDNAFRKGRSAILQRFLDRPAIYATPRMRSRYEEPARQNLRRSLLNLSGRKDL